MKKCPYCGKEYADDVERCLIDDELLLGEEPSPAAEETTAPKLQSLLLASAQKPSAMILTDRQIHVFEVVLVCVIAFGSAILTSTYSFYNSDYGASGRSVLV